MEEPDITKRIAAARLVIILIAVGLVAVAAAAFRGSSRIAVYSYNPTVSAPAEKTAVRQAAALPAASPTAAPTASPPPDRAVPAESGEESPPPESGLSEVLVPGSVHVNTATAEELALLPGIGPVLAQRIIDYRESQGGFTSPEELMEVRGIGEKTYAKLFEFVTVD